MRFIDSNILFRMFAASTARIAQYRETGSCGVKPLDYAIRLLLGLSEGEYSISEIALLETVSVAARLGGQSKAETLLRAVVKQERLRILETRALAYPLSFAFVLTYGLEARDALHLGVAMLGGASTLITSDVEFANGTERIVKQVADQGFELPRVVRAMYGLSDREAMLVEEHVARSLSVLAVERGPT